jgi:hypothetical protein
MSQKIVIKANVKREPQNREITVSYEWRWRRIVSISMLVIMISAAIVYGLTSSVNAEQNEHPNEQAHFLSFENGAVNVQFATVNTDFTDEQSAISKQSTDPILIKPMAQSELVDIAGNENTVFTAQVNVPAEPEAPKPEEIKPALATELQTSDDGALTGTQGFSPTAQVASVALGAQIDTGKISRAVLTRKVSKREPSNVFAADIRLSQFEKGLSFFSELKNLQGQQVKHVWSFEGSVMAEINLNVTSPRYRTYSTKNIMDSQTGHWRVDVLDEQGNLIAQKEFRILAN